MISSRRRTCIKIKNRFRYSTSVKRKFSKILIFQPHIFILGKTLLYEAKSFLGSQEKKKKRKDPLMATIFDPPRGEEFSRKWVTIGRDSAVITIENLTFMRYRRLDRRTVTIETSIPSASQVEWIPERRRRGTV